MISTKQFNLWTDVREKRPTGPPAEPVPRAHGILRLRGTRLKSNYTDTLKTGIENDTESETHPTGPNSEEPSMGIWWMPVGIRETGCCRIGTCSCRLWLAYGWARRRSSPPPPLRTTRRLHTHMQSSLHQHEQTVRLRSSCFQLFWSSSSE